jgi:hypothetical protein
MTQLKMDETGDLAIENNRFVLTDNDSDQEIRQRLLQRLRFFLGEWFLDRNEGVPWFQAIFVKETPPAIIDAILKERIIATNGVVSLERFDPLDLDIEQRLLFVSFDVLTINGTILSINGEL